MGATRECTREGEPSISTRTWHSLAQTNISLESVRLILAAHTNTLSYQTPIYSNVGLQLLGMAYENITGETWIDAFRKHITEPLQITRGFWKLPVNDSNQVNVDFGPGVPSSWYLDIQSP